MKKLLLILGFTFVSNALSSQELHPELLFNYYGIAENQMEIQYISLILQNNNLLMPSSEQEKAILEAHNYYLNHKKEIDYSLKVQELIEYRSAVKQINAGAWGNFFSTVTTGIQAGFAAGQRQQAEYQERLNRESKIQAYIAQHSSHSNLTIPQQNFGNNPNISTSNNGNRYRTTTSNGYDEPLPSLSENTTTNNNHQSVTNAELNMPEKIIQAVYVQGNQLVSCRLRFASDRIWAYSTSKDALNREIWKDFYPQSPSPTIPIQDGDNAREYKYKISTSGLTFYFNM